MNINEQVSCCEAVLFASGEPVDRERIAAALAIDPAEVDGIMNRLADRMEASGSGLRLLRLETAYQLCSKEEYVDTIRTVMDLKRRVPLSQAAMEVLAVVAYNQPVTKAYVEQVRGVDCSGVMSSLIEKGLLEEKGRLELPGRPLLYGTTDQFLRCFSMTGLADLPDLPEEVTAEDVGSQIAMEELDELPSDDA